MGYYKFLVESEQPWCVYIILIGKGGLGMKYTEQFGNKNAHNLGVRKKG